jgi:hypothetical protein
MWLYGSKQKFGDNYDYSNASKKHCPNDGIWDWRHNKCMYVGG